MARTVRIHTDDNVIVALEEMAAQTAVFDDIAGNIVTVTAVPLFHKIAAMPIAKGAPVVKYGAVIGVATQDIPTGAHVHVHNVDSADTMAANTEEH